MSAFMPMITALPADVNPYAWLKTFLWRQVSAEIKPWAKAIISLNLAVFALSFFIAGYALHLRRQQRSLWLFRIQSTSAGRLIIPNTTCLFSFCSLIFAPLLVWNCAIYLQQCDNDKVNTAPDFIGYAITWPPMLVGVWCETWSLCIAILLAYPSIKIKAIYMNIFFIAMLPVPTICNGPTFAIAAVRANSAWQKFRDIAGDLQPAIAAWTPGTAFQSNEQLDAKIGHFAYLGERLFPAVSTAIWTHLVGHVLIAVFFVPAAVLYFKIMRKQLGYSNNGSPSFTGTTSSYGGSAAGRLRDFRVQTLRAGYTAMLWECGAVSFGVVGYCALCVWIALRTRQVLTTTLESNLLFTIPYGIPANAVIALRLWKQKNDSRSFDAMYEPFGALSLVAGIKVEKETSVAVDSGDMELDEKARRMVIAFKPDAKAEHEIGFSDAKSGDGFSDSKSELAVVRASWRA